MKRSKFDFQKGSDLLIIYVVSILFIQRNTKNKQRRILSRMLDSQTSLSQRGYKEERKSYSSNESTIYSSSSGLPEDLGQRQSLALDALNRSLNSGYSKEYQNMIKRYFNAMTQIKNAEQKNENTN